MFKSLCRHQKDMFGAYARDSWKTVQGWLPTWNCHPQSARMPSGPLNLWLVLWTFVAVAMTSPHRSSPPGCSAYSHWVSLIFTRACKIGKFERQGHLQCLVKSMPHPHVKIPFVHFRKANYLNLVQLGLFLLDFTTSPIKRRRKKERYSPAVPDENRVTPAVLMV